MGVLSLVLTFLISSIAPAQQTADAALDAIGNEERDQQAVPGLVLVVVRGSGLAYAKGFGVANLETGEAVTADHLFRVGSTTKMMTGAAAMALALDGKLDLMAPAGDVLREHAGTPLGEITVHQMLTHTAGLMDRTLMFGRHDDQALADNVRSLQPDVLFTRPGAICSYSNLGYVIAGRVIEVVSGRPFADAMNDLVFAPLGMRRTTFRPTLAMTYPLAQGHIREGSGTKIGRPAADHSGYWPAGSMFTSGREFARFARALLGQKDSGLRPGVIAGITKPHVRLARGGGSYGYGIGVSVVNGKTVLRHGGARQGYSSHLLASPEEQLAVIVLINQSGADATRPAARAFHAVAGWNPEPEAKEPPTSLTPSQVAGTYTHYTRTIVVQQKNGKLVVTERGSDAQLTPASGNCFQAAGQGSLCFVTGASGRVEYLLSGSRALARQ